MDVTRFGGREELLPVLIDAVVRDPCYDMEAEGRRGGWIIEIAEKAGFLEAVEKEITLALEGEQFPEDNEWRSANHRRDVALELARRGFDRMAPLLRASVRRTSEGSGVYGVEEVVSLEGEEGLLFAAGRVGAMAREEPDLWFDGFEVEFPFDAEHGKGAAWRVLEVARRSDPLIAAYLKRTKRCRPHEGRLRRLLRWPSRALDEARRQRRMKLSGPKFVAAVRDEWQLFGVGWGRQADVKDLEFVLRALTTTTDAQWLSNLLAVFAHRAPPRLEPRFFALCEHEWESVRYRSYRALAWFEAPEVRDLALKSLRSERDFGPACELLARNYQPGDHRLIGDTLCLPEDEGEVHGIVGGLLDLAEAQDTPDLRVPLEFVYEHSPCSNCRRKAVRYLDEHGALAPWIREESGYDADEDLRERFPIEG